jgi:F-type H+-transporting ATPase subunit b
MQTLDIISVNLWNILISLANLALVFFVVKTFLFKPVKKLLAERQAALDHQYAAAAQAQEQADANRATWEQTMQGANAQADAMIKDAAAIAKHRATQIVEDADARARIIVSEAQTTATLERKRAEDEVRREIVQTATALAEKMLEREVNEKDHRDLIDTFIDQIGDEHGTDQ